MKKIVEIAHNLILEYAPKDMISVDFTMGRGNDTLLLAKYSRYVYAFDIQLECIEETRAKLHMHNLHNVKLICASHADADNYISEKIHAGIFNFGYLPQSDQQITTTVTTSSIAVKKALAMLEVKGILVLVLYPGHPAGYEEGEYFDDWTKQLPSRYYHVMRMEMWNKDKAPYILAIQKIREEETYECESSYI